MYPGSFDYRSASSVQEAVDFLAGNGGNTVELLAGGHSLIPEMKTGPETPDIVVDVADIDQLSGIEHGDGVSHIGATTTHAAATDDGTLDRETVIAETAAEIGDEQIRNAGTVGGNVADADPAADLPAAVLASDATIHAHGPDGQRTIPAAEFFEGPFTTALAEDELLTHIDVPHLGADDASAYVKKRNPSSGYALVGVAVVLKTDGGDVTTARVAVSGVFDHARRLEGVEDELTGGSIDDDGLAERAATDAAADAESGDILDDGTASREFRTHLLDVYTQRTVETAMERAD